LSIPYDVHVGPSSLSIEFSRISIERPPDVVCRYTTVAFVGNIDSSAARFGLLSRVSLFLFLSAFLPTLAPLFSSPMQGGSSRSVIRFRNPPIQCVLAKHCFWQILTGPLIPNFNPSVLLTSDLAIPMAASYSLPWMPCLATPRNTVPTHTNLTNQFHSFELFPFI